jgi:Fe-coproporphyrin III synthase
MQLPSVENRCALGTELYSIAALQSRSDDSHIIESLPILVIHAHSSCNCRCVMCDIWKTVEHTAFTVSDLESQLPSIRRLGVRWVVFSGGEPLLNPQLFQLCSILRAEGIRLTLLSTGLLFRKLAKEIAASFDDVIVSLDGPREIHDSVRRIEGAFELISDGIRALRTERSAIPIAGRSTVQKANHHCLWETASAAKDLGLDEISFLAADLTSPAFNRESPWPANRQTEIGLSLAEIALLENGIEEVIHRGPGELGPGFIAESPAKLRKIAHHFRCHLGLAQAESPVCNAPWVSAVLETDGTVRPCFFHRSIGNARGNALEDVLNASQARGFRKNLDVATNPTCRNCVCSLNYRAG